MIIGSQIAGTDHAGNVCSGIVLDKVLIVQTIQIPVPGSLVKQNMPIALDAYVVLDIIHKTLHFVNPMMISAVDLS